MVWFVSSGSCWETASRGREASDKSSSRSTIKPKPEGLTPIVGRGAGNQGLSPQFSSGFVSRAKGFLPQKGSMDGTQKAWEMIPPQGSR